MKFILKSLIALMILSGCATVKVYDDKELKERSGIKFYTPKPYLLVVNNPSKEVKIQSQIIYLPDLSQPKYAKVVAGLGSSDFKISLSNGVLTSYGLTLDSKIPETIESTGDLIADIGSVVNPVADAAEEDDAEQSNNVAIITQQKAQILNMKNDIDNIINQLSNNNPFTSAELTKLTSISVTLDAAYNSIVQFTTPEIETCILLLTQAASDLQISVSDPSDEAKTYLGKFLLIKTKIEQVIKKLKPEKSKSKQTKFDLFEIVMTKEGTVLKKVILQ